MYTVCYYTYIHAEETQEKENGLSSYNGIWKSGASQAHSQGAKGVGADPVGAAFN